MALTFTVTPGGTLTETEVLTNAKVNLAANPTVAASGSIGTSEISAGAVTDAKSTPGAYWFAASAGSSTTFTLTLSPALAALTEGAEVWFKANADFGAASTLNVNSLGAKNITKHGNVAIAAGDIKSGMIVGARYSTTAPGQWQVFSRLSYPDVINVGASTGSANTYALTLSPAIAANAELTGRLVTFTANFTNTGAANISVNGLANIDIKKKGGTALAAGDIQSGQAVAVYNNGTNWMAIGLPDAATFFYVGTVTLSGAAYSVSSIAGFPTAYSAGLVVIFKPDTICPASATLNINSIGAGALYINNAAVRAKDLAANTWYQAVYDGSNFHVTTIGRYLVTAEQAVPTTQSVVTVAHGLGVVPSYVRWVLVCKTNDRGYTAAAAHEVDVAASSNGSNQPSYTPHSDATNLNIHVSADNKNINNASTGANETMTASSWRLKAYYLP